MNAILAITVGGTVLVAFAIDFAALVGFLWRNGSGR